MLAVWSGTVHYGHDPGTDGGHFGDPYPWLAMDQPFMINGRTYTGFYLGHTSPVVPEGIHAPQGLVVARTTNPGGGGAPPGWLECGYWGPSGPVGKGSGWTQAGQDMHDALLNAPVFGGGDEEMVKSVDPKDGSFIIVKPDGSVYAFNANGGQGGHYHGGLNTHPQWGTGPGAPEGEAVAANHYDDGGPTSAYVIMTCDPQGQFHNYNFPSNNAHIGSN